MPLVLESEWISYNFFFNYYWVVFSLWGPKKPLSIVNTIQHNTTRWKNANERLKKQLLVWVIKPFVESREIWHGIYLQKLPSKREFRENRYSESHTVLQSNMYLVYCAWCNWMSESLHSGNQSITIDNNHLNRWLPLGLKIGLCSLWGARWGRRNSSTPTVFFVRYAFWPKKYLSIFYATQHRTVTWQHPGGWNELLIWSKNEGKTDERRLVEAREYFLSPHIAGTWLVASINTRIVEHKKCYILCASCLVNLTHSIIVKN
jgi:hypothetical protein